MRRRRRYGPGPGRARTRGGARAYSIAYLLEHQPKSLARHPDFSRMRERFENSERLKAVRFNRRCYSLLNRATVRPENLRYFYLTYRLPDDVFFAMFFRVKRDYFAEQQRKKEERHASIIATMRSLDPEIVAAIKYLGYLERHYNGAAKSPVWQRQLFPSSKRQADRYAGFDAAAWNDLFLRHLEKLADAYRITETVVARTHAMLVLRVVPDAIPPARPDARLVNRTYRKLTLRYHPDRGGDPRMFIEIKRARDTLL